jgi:Asp-tRNA(Asn)/Glu-tRNA(Gln) amidotransferase C subunit
VCSLRFGQLRDADLDGVEAAGGGAAGQATGRLRDDEAVEFARREEMLASAANLEAPFIRIPKILEAE